MRKRIPDQAAEVSPASGVLARVSWLIVVSSVITVPLFVGGNGRDSFRLPKDVLFIGAAIVLMCCGALALFRRPVASRLRSVGALALAAVLWTALAALFSANRVLSMSAFVWVAAAAIFAIAIDILGRSRGPEAIAWCLVPALANAFVFLLQRFHVWNPIHFQPDVPEHFRYSALIGNPDDVSSFLVGPALVAVALAVSHRRLRVLWIIAAIPLLAAVATGQLTAIIACGIALMVMGFMRSWRFGVGLAAATLISVLTLVTAYQPIRDRVANVAGSLKRHDYAEAFSGRVTPFFAAANMAVRHPLFGVGPGVFRWEFFTYKLDVERSHPGLAKAFASSFNFGEVHDEYLQTLAETGIIGCALLVAALFTIGRSSFGASFNSERDIFVRTLGLPLTVAVAVLFVAQFPLHLSAPLLILLYVCVLCVSWGPAAEFSWKAPAFGTAVGMTRPPVWVVAIVTIASAATGVVVFEKMCYWPYVCNVRKNAVYANTRIVVNAVDKYEVAGIARSNIGSLETCISENPSDIDLYMLQAANFHALGLNEQAVLAYKAALAYDRRPEIFYSLGWVELEMNRRQEAMEHLLLAVRFSRQYLQDLPSDVQAELTRTLQRDYAYLVGT